MSSPVGHAFVGLIFFTLAKRFDQQHHYSWKWLIVFIILAGLPDLDIIDGLASGPLHLIQHRTVSHSLLFTSVVGFSCAWFSHCILKKPRPTLWYTFPATIISHPFMDMCCMHSILPQGVQLFWPFSTAFAYTPLPFMTSIGTFTAYGNPFWLAFLKSGSLELVVFGSLYGFLRLLFYLQDRQKALLDI